MARRPIGWILFFLFMSASFPVSATTFNYTFNGSVRAFDLRADRYLSGNGARVSTATADTDGKVPNVFIFVYDQEGASRDCGGTDDLYMTVFTADANGDYSVSFSFTSNGIPDPYFCHKFYTWEHGVYNEDGTDSWDYGYVSTDLASGTYTRNFSLTCPDETDGECDTPAVANSQSLARRAKSNILLHAETANTALGSPDFNGYNTRISWRWRDDEDTGGIIDSTSYIIYVRQSEWDDNEILGRYLGWLLLKRATNQGYNSIGFCPGGVGWTTEVNQRCATSLGFAQFVSVAVNFFQNASYPSYDGSAVEGKTSMGSPSGSYCAGMNSKFVSRMPANATRFFWDLYDNYNHTDDRGGDGVSLTFSQIMAIWDNFPAGSGEHQANEDPNVDSDGRNVWDFWFRAGGYQSDVGRLIILNCMAGQEGPLNQP